MELKEKWSLNSSYPYLTLIPEKGKKKIKFSLCLYTQRAIWMCCTGTFLWWGSCYETNHPTLSGLKHYRLLSSQVWNGSAWLVLQAWPCPAGLAPQSAGCLGVGWARLSPLHVDPHLPSGLAWPWAEGGGRVPREQAEVCQSFRGLGLTLPHSLDQSKTQGQPRFKGWEAAPPLDGKSCPVTLWEGCIQEGKNGALFAICLLQVHCSE